MIKKAVIAVAIAAVVLLSSAGFIYAYNNEKQGQNQAAYSDCICGQDKALCQQERHEYRYQYNQDNQDCDGECQQLRNQERLSEDGQCPQLQQQCQQLRANQLGQGRRGRNN